MLSIRFKNLILLIFLLAGSGSQQLKAQGFSPIYACPGPYACVLSNYLGIKFPDGSTQTTAATGGGGGSVTIGTIDSQTPSTNGAVVSGGALFMQSASATRPGLVNMSTQTFNGAKTFSSSPVMSALSASQAVVTNGSKALASFPYTDANTASSLVSRDASGNFSAGTISAALNGIASGNPPSTRTISTTSPLQGGGDLSANRTLSIAAANGSTDGYLTSANWTLFNSKQAAGNYILGLSGDVSATGPGTVGATVNSVGGSSAANVNAATVLANSATDANTASAIVRRDASGNITVTNVTGSLTGTASGNPPSSRTISTTAPLSGGGDLSANRTLSIPAATTSVDGYLTSADWNTFSGKQSAGNYVTSLTGDVTGSGPGATATTVASVGGSSAAAVNTATVLANSATDSATPGTLVLRDGSGAFAGDLTGSASKVGGITVTGTPSTGNVLTATGASAANWQAPASGGLSALTGDVTASGSGSQPATVVSVGGAAAADVATASTLANAATNANTPSTIVKRDGSGNITVGQATATTFVGALTGTASGNLVSGGALGTPSSGTLTNATGLPIAGITGLGTGVGTFLATPSSANLASVLTDETGSGAAVFAVSPAFTTPDLGTPSAAVLTNATGTASGLTAGTATAANGLKSASTTVSVSAATAPSSGQVLTATSGTAATWQTPSGGSAASDTTAGTVTSYVPVIKSGVSTTSGANVTATQTDGFEEYQVASAGTGLTLRTVTFPAASVSAGRTIKVVKTDAAYLGSVGVTPAGSDVLNGASNQIYLSTIGSYSIWQSDGTSWNFIGGSTTNGYGVGQTNNYVAPISQSASTGWGTSGAGVTLSTVTTASYGSQPRDKTQGSAIKIIRASGSTDYAYYRFYVDNIDTTNGNNGQHCMLVSFSYAVANATTGDWKLTLTQTSSSSYASQSSNVTWGANGGRTTYAFLPATTLFSSDWHEVNVCAMVPGNVSGNGPYWEFRIGLNASSASTTVYITDMFIGTMKGPSKAPGHLIGETFGTASDVAIAGEVGELKGPISRVKSNSTSLTTATTVNIGTTTSVTLTPGDWTIFASCGFIPDTTTTVTALTCGISTTSATMPGTDTLSVPDSSGQVTQSHGFPSTVFGAVDYTMAFHPVQVSVSSNTAYYLVGRSTFGVSTMGIYGSMYAQRRR